MKGGILVYSSEGSSYACIGSAATVLVGEKSDEERRYRHERQNGANRRPEDDDDQRPDTRLADPGGPSPA